jgi:DTW domain-containing protein
MTAAAPRPCCTSCRRPLTVCFCARITVLPTRTRILLLQHARERRVGIGTARMAHLALPGSVLRVGLDFAADPVVQEALQEPPTYLLFPGPDACPLEQLPRDRPVTLVVVDGTWWQARKLLRLNPVLAALPRVAFRPRRPSGYLIRRQPADFCLSTIEALAETLETLEPDGARFQRLLDPFAAMVDRQRRFETEVNARRHHRDRSERPGPRARLAARLAAAWPRIVCVQGEANGWSRHDPARQDPEVVHWVAHRPATGDRFEAIIAPRRPLAPATPSHVELGAERLLAGTTVDGWQRSWQAFTRPDDLVVVWGVFHLDLAARDALCLPPETLDLRAALTPLLKKRHRTIDEALTTLGARTAPPSSPGRGPRRLSALVAAVTALVTPHRS